MTAIQPNTDSARRRHREMLLISLATIVLSFLLVIRADGRVAFRGLEAHAVPETCLAHSLFGIDCPACGLTRSFICLAQGDLAGSLAFHRLGWMMALAVVLQVPYRAGCLLSDRSLARVPASAVGYLIIAALLLNWILPHARLG
jgi:hypothetical protein